MPIGGMRQNTVPSPAEGGRAQRNCQWKPRAVRAHPPAVNPSTLNVCNRLASQTPVSPDGSLTADLTPHAPRKCLILLCSDGLTRSSQYDAHAVSNWLRR